MSLPFPWDLWSPPPRKCRHRWGRKGHRNGIGALSTCRRSGCSVRGSTFMKQSRNEDPVPQNNFKTCNLLNAELLIGKILRDGHQDPQAALGTHDLKLTWSRCLLISCYFDELTIVPCCIRETVNARNNSLKYASILYAFEWLVK